MEITPENIEKVKEADRQVSAVVDRLTPKNVLEMIRDGVNPLEKTLTNWNPIFHRTPKAMRKKWRTTAVSYISWNGKRMLQKRNEKRIWNLSNGASGRERGWRSGSAVVNTGADLQFSTLLTAARSRRASHMDWESVGGYRADTGDSFVRE